MQSDYLPAQRRDRDEALSRSRVCRDMTTQQIPYLHTVADAVIAGINHHDVDKSEKGLTKRFLGSRSGKAIDYTEYGTYLRYVQFKAEELSKIHFQ